jgi:uncharacterized protein (DUF2267 family)
MSAQHLEVFETTLHKAHQWVDALAQQAHLDPHLAYQALRAVLHTLRDRLPVDETVHLGAQLPLLLRGVYYEGWRPALAPQPLSRAEFLARVSEKLVAPRVLDPACLVRDALGVCARFLGIAPLAKISLILPAELRGLFPSAAPPAASGAGSPVAGTTKPA